MICQVFSFGSVNKIFIRIYPFNHFFEITINWDIFFHSIKGANESFCNFTEKLRNLILLFSYQLITYKCYSD